MNEEFRRQHAKTVREIAEKADPFTKKRLLELAAQYDVNGSNASAALRKLTAAASDGSRR